MRTISKETFYSRISEKIASGRIPETVTLEVTYGCNLRCVHCYNPVHRPLPHELKKEEIFGLLRQMKELGVLSLTFSGGEPFCRADIFDLLLEAKQLGFVLTLITNATLLTDQIAAELEKIGHVFLDISLYGTTRATYEQVTGIPGSFERFMKGLKSVSKRKIPVCIQMPVMTLNAGEIDNAQELCRTLGLRFRTCVEIRPKSNGDTTPLNYRLSPDEKLAFYSQETSGHYESRDYSRLHDERFLDCACGQTQFAITPAAEMNLCAAFPIPKFDLRKGTIREGWKILKQTADQAKPNHSFHCTHCEVRSFCRQGRNDAYLETGNMSKCLAHFRELALLEKAKYDAATAPELA
ncbi:MAG: radical SAM protein [Candidatus Omnitrophica bacterium]|nr:radical SAM protein [Candidatus Omnitrophota bacterium]